MDSNVQHVIVEHFHMVLSWLNGSYFLLSGHAHLWSRRAQLAATSFSNLGCCRRPTRRPLRGGALAGHGPSEETDAHLEQLTIYHRCTGVLLGLTLSKEKRKNYLHKVYVGTNTVLRDGLVTLSFFNSCLRMAKSRRAHKALQQGPRLLSKPALSTRLFRAAIFSAPRSCSKSLSASEGREQNGSQNILKSGREHRKSSIRLILLVCLLHVRTIIPS